MLKPGTKQGFFRKMAGCFPGKLQLAIFFRKNVNGILGTVAFHLFIVALFMFSKLNTANREYQQAFLVDFQEDYIHETEESAEDDQTVSEVYDNVSGEVRRNIAVSESERRPVPDEFRDYSPEQMEQLENRVEDILENASKGEFPKLSEPEIEFEKDEYFGEQYLSDDNDSEPYTGPTNIYYDIPGREALYIPVPVYKCPDGGVVTVNITVNNNGNIINAEVKGDASGFNEMCLHEEALQAALRSRFSNDHDAPPVQSGTITFHFQRQ